MLQLQGIHYSGVLNASVGPNYEVVPISDLRRYFMINLFETSAVSLDNTGRYDRFWCNDWLLCLAGDM